ncbi:endolysin [Pseudomonas phage vB_PpuP-Kurepalu-1]
MKQLSKVAIAAVMSATALLAGVEGLSLKTYKDTGGVVTWCYGETRGPVPTTPLTKTLCYDMLESSVVEEYAWVSKKLPGLNPNQYAALVSFCYNVGRTACDRSTLFRYIRAGKYELAGREFHRWRFVGKLDCAVRANKCYGLVLRRKAEAAMWSKP